MMRSTRRYFMSKIGAIFGILALIKPDGAAAKTKKVAVRLSKVPKLKRVGGQTALKLKGRSVLLMRTGEKTVAATSSICSHAKCPLFYNHRTTRVECDCHGSKFTLAGKVLNGPAAKDIERYPASLSGDRIIIELGG